jgi:curved DNA-binding protein CbpA
VSADELKSAWRRACKEHHPDRNPDDPAAGKRFAVLNCAYQFLAVGHPCQEILREAAEDKSSPQEEEKRPDDSWGHFLWWRDKFF